MCYILLHYCKLCSTPFTKMFKGSEINAQETEHCSWKKVNYGDQNLDFDVGIEEKFYKGEMSRDLQGIFMNYNICCGLNPAEN